MKKMGLKTSEMRSDLWWNWCGKWTLVPVSWLCWRFSSAAGTECRPRSVQELCAKRSLSSAQHQTPKNRGLTIKQLHWFCNEPSEKSTCTPTFLLCFPKVLEMIFRTFLHCRYHTDFKRFRIILLQDFEFRKEIRRIRWSSKCPDCFLGQTWTHWMLSIQKVDKDIVSMCTMERDTFWIFVETNCRFTIPLGHEQQK